MATNLRVNSDSYKSTWTLHSNELYEYESMATRTNGLRLVYVWMGLHCKVLCITGSCDLSPLCV